MKHICLIRHAHAVSHELLAYDHDRVLSDRGKKESLSLAKLIASAVEPSFDVIFCSSSLRTKGTAEILNKSLNTKTVYDDELYNADEAYILNLISKAEENSIAIIAHNPGISSVSSILSGMTFSLETGQSLYLTFDIKDWSDLYLNPKPVNQKFLAP